VIADASIQQLEVVAIGGGARGVNVHLAPADLIAATGARVEDITIPDDRDPAPAAT
jgi:prolyl-tRNA editing enzyme YbaK/EbsC (Cys-tRNA(Pro) deacylase)